MVSIIVCTHNRDKYLPKCLDRLSNQTADKNLYEIIVVNNNCTDRTETICLDFKRDNPQLQFIYTLENNPGLSWARNKGIEVSNGEILAFIDDDGFAKNDYVENIIAVTNQYNLYTAFGGKVIPVYNEGKYPEWLSYHIQGVVSKVDLGNQIKDFDKKYPVGCNMIIRKSFFEQHGGFNTSLELRGDDKFIFHKMKKLKLKVLYVPNIYVEHFMDDFRIEKNYIIKISKVVGHSEKVRLENSSPGLKFLKALEYVFKLGAAFFFMFYFGLTGSFAKAEYIVLVRWNVLKGFFIKHS